ncbi:hypothetical protein ACWDBT_34635 [Streptomyces ardesiacus]
MADVQMACDPGGGIGGLRQAAPAVRLVGAQLGRAPQSRYRAVGVTAPQAEPGRRLHDGGDRLVRDRRRSREVITAPLGLVGQRVGQSVVGAAPLFTGGTVDYRGPDQRMPEAHRAAVLCDHDQMVTLRGSEFLKAARPAGSLKDADVAGALKSREQQHLTRSPRQSSDAGAVQSADIPPRAARPTCPLAVLVAGRPGELEQRQGISLRLVCHGRKKPAGKVSKASGQQPQGVRVTQRRDLELRQTGGVEGFA